MTCLDIPHNILVYFKRVLGCLFQKVNIGEGTDISPAVGSCGLGRLCWESAP